MPVFLSFVFTRFLASTFADLLKPSQPSLHASSFSFFPSLSQSSSLVAQGPSQQTRWLLPEKETVTELVNRLRSLMFSTNRDNLDFSSSSSSLRDEGDILRLSSPWIDDKNVSFSTNAVVAEDEDTFPGLPPSLLEEPLRSKRADRKEEEAHDLRSNSRLPARASCDQKWRGACSAHSLQPFFCDRRRPPSQPREFYFHQVKR